MMAFAPFACGSCTKIRKSAYTNPGKTALVLNLCGVHHLTHLAGSAGIPSPVCEEACHLCRQDSEQRHEAAAEQLEVSAATMDG